MFFFQSLIAARWCFTFFYFTISYFFLPVAGYADRVLFYFYNFWVFPFQSLAAQILFYFTFTISGFSLSSRWLRRSCFILLLQFLGFPFPVVGCADPVLFYSTLPVLFPYPVVGCADPAPFENAQYFRNNDELTIKCNFSQALYQLKCVNNEWRGQRSNCSERE